MELEITKDLHKKVSRTLQHTLIMQCIFQSLFYLGLNVRPSPVEFVENIISIWYNNYESGDYYVSKEFLWNWQL